MKKSKILFAGLLVFALCALGLFLIQRPPAEAEMIANFKEHKGAFEKLIKMARADHLTYCHFESQYCYKERIRKVDSKTGIVEFEEIELSHARLQDYIKVAQNAGVSLSIICADNCTICSIPVFGGGFADTTWAVGYTWSDKPVAPIVESAYNHTGMMRGTRVYSKIDGIKNWYIFRSA